MLPEDRLVESLDVLLAARRSPPANGDNASASDTRTPAVADLGELDSALEAAGRLDAVRAALPHADFAQALEERLLHQTAALRAAREREAGGIVSGDVTVSDDRPQGTRRALGRGEGGQVTRLSPRGRWRLWQTLAAAVLLAVVGASALAATATPGSPLYGLRTWGQDVRAGLGTSPADQVRLHLQYASAALDALTVAVSQQSGGNAYRTALSTALDEENDAAAALTAVLPGDQRTSLTAQLTSLRQRDHQEIHASLPHVDWTSRLYFTTTLGTLGETVPVITTAHIERASGSGHGGGSGSDDGGSSGYTWTVELTGSGLQSGAICVVDGHPIGTTLSVTPTQMVVEWPAATTPSGAAFGIQNPDDTAAQTANIQHGDDSGNDSTSPSPSPAATATDGGGHGGGGHGGGPGHDG